MSIMQALRDFTDAAVNLVDEYDQGDLDEYGLFVGMSRLITQHSAINNTVVTPVLLSDGTSCVIYNETLNKWWDDVAGEWIASELAASHYHSADAAHIEVYRMLVRLHPERIRVTVAKN